MSIQLPRIWRNGRWPGFNGRLDIIAETDLSPTLHGRLRAKCLVFRNNRSMSRFWSRCLKCGPLERNCFGAVQQLCTYIEDFSDPNRPKVRMGQRDPRYFCIIGLVATHISTMHVTHEMVHAGFAYMKRVKGKPWAHVEECDEESVAYPTGYLMRRATAWLYSIGLWK